MRSEQEIRAQLQLLEGECARFEALLLEWQQSTQPQEPAPARDLADLEAMLTVRRQAIHTLRWVLGEELAQTPV